MFIKKNVKNLKLSGIRSFNNLALDVENVISLTLGEPYFNTPINIKNQTKWAVDKNYTKYTLNKGLLPLRKEITKDSMFNEEECILTVGATEAISVVIKSIIGQDDEIILFTPGYVGYQPLIDLEQGKACLIDVLDKKITYELLKKHITKKTKAILITNPNNPTGKVLSLEEIKCIEKIVLEYHLCLIADEIYSKLTYTQFYSFRNRKALKKHLVVIDGFSKSHQMTGYRIGYLLSDLSLINEFVKTHQYMVTSTSSLAQYALLNHVDIDIDSIKTQLKEQRDLVLQTLDELNIKYVYPNGAFYVFYKIDDSYPNSLSYCKKLLYENKVALIPGRYFLGHMDRYVRLSYAGKKEDLIEALNRIKTFEYNNQK